MNAHADNGAFLSSLLGGAVMLWTFLSVIRCVLYDPCCAPWRRGGIGMRSLTDPLPWALTRIYGRIAGVFPPTWFPWTVAFAIYFAVACLCQIVLDRLS